ncbi:MAG TPA: hypothetical protein VER17_19850 [Tepidisphaeraceae bacterium]|nr:hypothetical protein [Tepidisphaeraceae bacterium]
MRGSLMCSTLTLSAMVAACCATVCTGAATPTTASTTTGSSTAPTTASATNPSTRRSAADASRVAVRAAASALAKEFEAHLRSPGKSDIRSACTYFKDKPSPDVTPQAIVAALGAPAGDGRTAAYVRWQLLSGVPEAPDPQYAKELLAAYRASPGPSPRPGAAPAEQQALDRALQGRTADDASGLTQQLDAAVARSRQDNAAIFSYREELYRRLPKNPDAFVMAMEDLHQRLLAGAEAKDFVKQFATDVRDWAATTPPSAAALLQTARAVRKLADARGPQYYTAAYWHEPSRRLAWRKTRAGIDAGNELKDLAVYLEEQAQHQPAPAAAAGPAPKRR